MFTDDLFVFLRALRRNNDRDWFHANKSRHEQHIKRPALAFIDSFSPFLDSISPAFLAEPKAAGGSLFRIHRDVRFSKDKSPYKTSVGIQFRHRAGKDAHAPGFYLHLEPKGCFAGVGIWHPETKIANRIRDAIGEDPAEWKKAAYGRGFTRRFSLSGDSLKRVPSRFAADHEYGDDLRRKDFIAVAPEEDSAVTRKGFMAAFAKDCRSAAPFMAFLCDAVGVSY